VGGLDWTYSGVGAKLCYSGGGCEVNSVPCNIRSPQTSQGQALTALAESPSAHSTDRIFIAGPSAAGRAALSVAMLQQMSSALQRAVPRRKNVYYVTFILFV